MGWTRRQPGTAGPGEGSGRGWHRERRRADSGAVVTLESPLNQLPEFIYLIPCHVTVTLLHHDHHTPAPQCEQRPQRRAQKRRRQCCTQPRQKANRPDALLRRETHRPLKPLLQIPRSRAPLLLPQTDNPNIPPSPSNRSILPTRPRPPRLLHERTLAVSIRNANGQNQPKGHNPSHRKISAAACQSHQTRQTHGYHGFT